MVGAAVALLTLLERFEDLSPEEECRGCLAHAALVVDDGDGARAFGVKHGLESFLLFLHGLGRVGRDGQLVQRLPNGIFCDRFLACSLDGLAIWTAMGWMSTP